MNSDYIVYNYKEAKILGFFSTREEAEQWLQSQDLQDCQFLEVRPQAATWQR